MKMPNEAMSCLALRRAPCVMNQTPMFTVNESAYNTLFFFRPDGKSEQTAIIATDRRPKNDTRCQSGSSVIRCDSHQRRVGLPYYTKRKHQQQDFSTIELHLKPSHYNTINPSRSFNTHIIDSLSLPLNRHSP